MSRIAGDSQPRLEHGALVRLKDVGRAELGAEDYSGKLRFNGYEGIGIGEGLIFEGGLAECVVRAPAVVL